VYDRANRKPKADPRASAGPAARAPVQRAAAPTPYHSLPGSVGLTQPNRTGLPDGLKSGIEGLSGLSMDDVRVHRGSSRPATIQAHAYTQGSEIHLAPGQERHLAHEAWHVVQQKQGRVAPTMRLGDTAINDDAGLEGEADRMGTRALSAPSAMMAPRAAQAPATAPVQRVISYASGRFDNREQLEEALLAIFTPKWHKKVLALVQGYDDADWKIFGSQVYDYIVATLKKKGAVPTFAVTTVASSSPHGPKMPNRINRKADVDQGKATDTFNFSSVTLGRSILSHGRKQADFHDRNDTGEQLHAEDGLIEQLESYIETNAVTPRRERLNITLNNFFCSHETTTKSRKEDNCLDKIIGLQDTHKFSTFHVYFKNTYGKPSLMTKNIKKLKKHGIKVSSFTNESDHEPYYNEELDPHSEDEGGESVEVESSEDEKPKKKAKRKPLPRKESKRETKRQKTPSKPQIHEESEESEEDSSSSKGKERRPRKKGRAQSSSSKRSPRKPRPDVVKWGGHRFSPNTEGVRDVGQCFWDTLRSYGIHHNTLRAAATAADVEFEEDMDAQDLAPFIENLQGRGYDYSLRLVTFNIFTLRHLHTVDVGEEGEDTKRLYIALFFDPEERRGHYVPEL